VLGRGGGSVGHLRQPGNHGHSRDGRPVGFAARAFARCAFIGAMVSVGFYSKPVPLPAALQASQFSLTEPKGSLLPLGQSRAAECRRAPIAKRQPGAPPAWSDGCLACVCRFDQGSGGGCGPQQSAVRAGSGQCSRGELARLDKKADDGRPLGLPSSASSLAMATAKAWRQTSARDAQRLLRRTPRAQGRGHAREAPDLITFRREANIDRAGPKAALSAQTTPRIDQAWMTIV
jgi:hypothetical protein